MNLREAAQRRDIAESALHAALQRPDSLRRRRLCAALVRLVNVLEWNLAREAAAGNGQPIAMRLDSSGIYQIDFAHVGGVP